MTVGQKPMTLFIPENSERLLFAKIIVNSNVFIYDKYQFLDGVTNEDINEFISYLKR